jgi:5-methylcytosine-specific restriction endonuclease McrA
MKRDYGDRSFKEFRLKVLKRDKFTCQMCNKKGKRARLNVHHIIKWASASSLRYDEQNGITLCYDCHKSITGKETYYASYLLSLIRKKYE